MTSNDSRELVFIQAGPASNWIGAHFWNLQESIVLQNPSDSVFNAPSLFRLKEKSGLANAMPRLIAIDTLGSIRSPHVETASSMPNSVTVAWGGDVQTIVQDAKPQSHSNGHDHAPVVNGDSELRYWTDCLLPSVKRRWKGEESVSVIRDFLDASFPGDLFASPTNSQNNSQEHIQDSDSPSTLSLFAQGTDLYRPGGEEFEKFEDYFHHLVEECDRPSGFSLLIDSDSGFSGVGLRLGEYLSEEFAKSPLFTSAVASSPLQNHRRWSIVCLNRIALYSAMEMASSWSSCSAWCPLMDVGDVCSTTSRLAAGLTTLLTPMLLKSSHVYSADLHEFVKSLTPTRKKMMSFSLVNERLSSEFNSKPKWTHANTFSICQKTSPELPSTYPLSLACQFSTRGYKLEDGQFISCLPHSGGVACSIEQGLQPRLSCCLPTDVLNAPHSSSAAITSSCSQSRSRAHVLLEAVSHWTEESQWLARGLKQNMDSAFLKFHNTCIEKDELKQIQECAVDRLVEAYASMDG
ncbi:unnamed protein product [Rodentolepis nana]|uniref:Misat_Tub_SegII domain-containing protein n=1 Tax=Rodentolepis nana TaxID=102285 RepID=A0A0R3TK00_RODNA|nr:unnamed protein product [Rodentolepis nana]